MPNNGLFHDAEKQVYPRTSSHKQRKTGSINFTDSAPFPRDCMAKRGILKTSPDTGHQHETMTSSTQPDHRRSQHDDWMDYELTRLGTGMGVGWFSCVPRQDLDFETALTYGRKHPCDLFMHRHLLDMASKLEPDDVESLIEKGKDGNPFLLALMWETCFLHEKHMALKFRFDNLDIEHLEEYSPLIYIRHALSETTEDHTGWLKCFAENIGMHKPMPSPEDMDARIPVEQEAIDNWHEKTRNMGKPGPSQKEPVPPPEKSVLKKAAKDVVKKLESLGILEGWETRTEATLSPYAVERPWKMGITVDEGRNRLNLSGTLTSFGRGLNIHQARISCYMEMAERYSSFAGFGSGRAIGYKKEHRLVKDRYENLVQQGISVLDPNTLCLEIPYRNQELYWIKGEKSDGNNISPIYVPAQLIFLFPNLDEPSLTNGLPSTGLGAGSSMAHARISGLLEVIERDSEKVVPFSKDRGFLLESEDPAIMDIIEGNKHKGIHIQFQDITSEFGIPCYRAFVQGPGGVILKGSAAGLNGRQTAVSAMTEIPYPYPYWFGSMTSPEGLRIMKDDDLPNFSSGVVTDDLKRVEDVLFANGYHPIYVDLTREDLDIPVVKALVPGLEMTTGIDRFSRISLRQFGHYLMTTAG